VENTAESGVVISREKNTESERDTAKSGIYTREYLYKELLI
jgi:hypothetical protein